MARYYATTAALPLDQLCFEPKPLPPNVFITKYNFESKLLEPKRGWVTQSLNAANEKKEEGGRCLAPYR